MLTETVRRHYDDIIASNYDVDPQGITGKCQDFAIEQLQGTNAFAPGLPNLRVLDLGMGTGMFLSKLRHSSARQIDPYGLDLSENMAAQAKRKHPDLQVVVDDAACFDDHFPGQTFDLICTHFITGFVPLSHLILRIWDRLSPGGYWSFLGATKSAYPALQNIANGKLVKRLFGASDGDIVETGHSPDNLEQAQSEIEQKGFEICDSKDFRPELIFANFEAFMEYAYYGGWLTPYVEGLGLQQIGWPMKKLVNLLIFPLQDYHHVAAVVARKPILND
ncbi:MAG: class I SAM-dependent methyltransferase [Planctomycetaceae bacterium]|nr:class I SAM-dependent methyltransferase [Planctomycetaceae bacterium]